MSKFKVYTLPYTVTEMEHPTTDLVCELRRRHPYSGAYGPFPLDSVKAAVLALQAPLHTAYAWLTEQENKA